LKAALQKVSGTIANAFNPKEINQTSSAIMKQQAVVDELEKKL